MTKSSKKEIYKKFAKNSRTNLRFSAVISFIVVIIYAFAALILNYYSSFFSGMLGILLIILFLSCLVALIQPFIYSFFALNTLQNSDEDRPVGMTEFFRGYMVGSKRMISTLLLIPSTLLYSFLIYFASSFILGFVTYGTLFLVNPEYQELYKQILIYIQANNQEGLTTLLNANMQLINTPLVYLEFFSTFFGFYYFIHRIGLNIFKYYLLPYAFNCNKSVFQNVYKSTIKENRKYFYSNYYSVLYPLVILVCIIYPLTYFLLYFLKFHNNSILILGLTSIVVTILFLLPFLPILFNFYEVIVEKFAVLLIARMRSILEEELNQLNEALENATDEEKAQINAFKSYLNTLNINNENMKEKENELRIKAEEKEAKEKEKNEKNKKD